MNHRFLIKARRSARYIIQHFSPQETPSDDVWQEEGQRHVFNGAVPTDRDGKIDVNESAEDYPEYDDQEKGDSELDKENDVYWECCPDDSTWVILPPEGVKRPSAVVHFVGATFFGSSPKLWYRTLLEGLVKMTNCCVVATAIPVTVLSNPLQHVKLSRNIQESFHLAFLDVLVDEYGEDIVGSVPIMGLGHSLGSRLLTILLTLKKQPGEIDYDAMVLVSFTNYGATASVPGVKSLLSERLRIDRAQEAEKQDMAKNPFYDDEAIMEEMFEMLGGAARSIKDALTPNEESLEFYPPPDALWRALKDEARFKVPHSLLVQFTDDAVDQSARLASAVKNFTSLHFCRLHGSHLTPINLGGDDSDDEFAINNLLADIPSRASQGLWRFFTKKNRASIQRQQVPEEESIQDLIKSISTYLTDVLAQTVKQHPVSDSTIS